jgi:uncharacterized protein (TIGR00297 family)
LSKLGHREKVKLRGLIEKGEKRDIIQVFANGGLLAFFALSYWFLDGKADFLTLNNLQLLTYQLFLGSLATANADTWATEIGLLSKQEPISLKNFQKIPKGASGGITLIGTLGALGGAFLISYFYKSSVLVIALAGFLGNLTDSYLGATLQAQYRCPMCEMKTEKHIHCNLRTVLESGIPWMNNDWVNFFATLTGALIVLMFQWITPR